MRLEQSVKMGIRVNGVSLMYICSGYYKGTIPKVQGMRRAINTADNIQVPLFCMCACPQGVHSQCPTRRLRGRTSHAGYFTTRARPPWVAHLEAANKD